MPSCSPGFIPSAVLMNFVMLFSFFCFIIHTVRKNSRAKVKVSLPDDFCLISYAGVHGDTATLSCLGIFVVWDREASRELCVSQTRLWLAGTALMEADSFYVRSKHSRTGPEQDCQPAVLVLSKSFCLKNPSIPAENVSTY